MDRLKDSYVGRYLLRRTIQDDRDRLFSRMKGFAHFSPLTKESLFYEEDVQHFRKDRVFAAKNAYIFTFSAQGIAVSFPDGRLFLWLPSGEDDCLRGNHLCKEDLYRTMFQKNGNEILWTFRVKGPRKDYFSETKLTKLTDS